MSAKLKRLNPGDPISHISASTWNAFVDTVQQTRTILGGDSFGSFDPTPTTIRVQNLSGGLLVRGAVVQINTLVANLAIPVFGVGVPPGTVTPLSRRQAVLLEPIKPNNLGEAAIAGIVKTNCLIGNIEVPAVEWNGTKFASHPGGSHKIVLPVAQPGDFELHVQLFSWSQTAYRGITAAPITAGGSGSVTLPDLANFSVTASLDWMHGDEGINTGREVIVEWFRTEAKWRITHAECEPEVAPPPP